MFEFKQFAVDDYGCGMKIGSDSVLLGAWFLPQVAGVRSLIDAGAGSGVLALMASQVCTEAAITAVEIDAAAAEACRRNVEASHRGGRIAVEQGDFRTLLHPAVDAIISNPPYFTETTLAPLRERALARHQTNLTYGDLLHKSKALLKPDGRLGLIAPADHEDALTYLGELAGLPLLRLCRVHTSAAKPPKRIMAVFGKSAEPALTESLTIGSEEYKALVEPFYIRIH